MSVHTVALLNLQQLTEADPTKWLQTLSVSPAYVYHTHRFLALNEGFATLEQAIQADVKEQLQGQVRLVEAEQAELRRCKQLAETIICGGTCG